MLRHPAYFNCSLREILLIAAFLGVGLAALKAGGLLAALLQLLSLVIAIGITVAAIVEGRGVRLFAAGFLVALAAYAGLLYWHGEAEFDPARGRLFATQAFEPLYETVKHEEYYDVYARYVVTGEKKAELSRYSKMPVDAVDLQVPYEDMTEQDRVVKTQYTFYRYDEIPDRKSFMTAAHLLVAMALAYGSGKFALALHRRKGSREAAANSSLADQPPLT